MYGKMLFNVLLGLPAAIISLLLFSYSTAIPFGRLLLMLFVVISLSLAVTVLGSVINLFVPKFEFRNPTEVVKQSLGALLGVFSGFTILILDGLLYYFLTKSASLEIGFLAIGLLNFLFFGGLLFVVNKKVESLFIKFEV